VVLRAILLCFLFAGVAGTSAAQTPDAQVPETQPPPPPTRAELLRQEREEKSKDVKAYEPNAIQKGLAFVEDRGLFLTARDGWHPKIGTLTTGSGLTLGAGWRNRAIFARRGTLDTFAAASFSEYWAVEARATFPQLARHRVMAEVVTGLREYPREDYFGLGPYSLRRNQTDFLLRTARVGGTLGVRPASVVLVAGGLEYLLPRVGRGRDDNVPDIDQVFDETTAPGLNTRSDYVRSSGLFEIDYRRPKNARQGGYYRLELSHFEDQKSGDMTFNRVDLDVRQYIGFFAGRRVIALRGVLTTSDSNEQNEKVPFYLMPYLGGKDTLRGFRKYRFRGPHSLMFQAEYRYEIWSGFDGALFYDTGKVALRREDLNLQHLESNYGIGFRFNTDAGVVMRVDAAFGSRDGKHLKIVLGGVF
jgi:Omp85 superfamily domain